MINSLETKFKSITGISPVTNLEQYPLTEHIGFDIRTTHKGKNGEVFTPLQIVDRMLEIAQPKSNQFNMDLCAGRGQFTIRILRKFVNENSDFNIKNYLRDFHWFNEFNKDSCIELIEIFGEDINLCIGPAQELKLMEESETGIFIFNSKIKSWVKIKAEEILTYKETSKTFKLF
jgi:hypothetical protein